MRCLSTGRFGSCSNVQQGGSLLIDRLVSNFGVDINRTDAFDASPLMLVDLAVKRLIGR